MASFLDVRGVLVRREFVVQCNPKIFETVHYFHRLVIDEDGLLVRGRVNDQFLCLFHIEMEMIVLTPLSEVGDAVTIVLDGVIVCQ